MINLDELLFQAYTLGVETNDKTAAFTKAQLRSVLFRSVPLLGKVESPAEDSESEKPAKKTTKTKAEKTESEAEKKPRKPRAAVDDEVRCHARTFNEKEHLENGKPKVMIPDDEDNLYGGRCSAKKNGESDFCKMHAEKQAHGVWGGAYGEKCNGYLAQPEKEVKPKKTIVKKAPAVEPVVATPKKVVKKAAKVEAEAEDGDDDVEEQDDDEYVSSVNKLEEAKVEYDWTEIDGEDYMIDAEGNVYDPESEGKIGNYNTKTKKWISGGPKADEADDE
jgi:hypothetical protein